MMGGEGALKWPCRLRSRPKEEGGGARPVSCRKRERGLHYSCALCQASICQEETNLLGWVSSGSLGTNRRPLLFCTLLSRPLLHPRSIGKPLHLHPLHLVHTHHVNPNRHRLLFIPIFFPPSRCPHARASPHLVHADLLHA